MERKEVSEEEFPFPFPPYEIQKNFMKSLYDALDASNVGIFESPTGTVCMSFMRS